MQALHGVVRHYDWGHRRAIADILGRRPSGRPEAEYWLGAHPAAPSRVGDEGARALDEVVATDPWRWLGTAVAERFGELPYLLKILAADRPLSIQAHPNEAQAAAGYAREEAAGIDRWAPDRNYRDAKHKPELICALTPFEAKCGFRPVDATRRLLARMPSGTGLGELRTRLDRPAADPEILADVLAWLLRLTPAAQAALAAEAAAGASAVVGEAGGGLRGSDDEFGVELAWTVEIHRTFPGDVGAVVALLLNHVSLRPGQAVFLGAGNLHCYLDGVAIELMANSDNVLRGGLTSKHVDVDELLGVVSPGPIEVPVQTARGPVHTFDAPVPEFSLTRLDSSTAGFDVELAPVGPEIVLVTAGQVELSTSTERRRLAAGSSILVAFADGPYRITDRAPGLAVAWRATVGG